MTVYGYCKSDPDIPIGELDYGFIEKCEDTAKLQKILAILRSGEEGRYPDLERFAESQLAKKKPDSPLLEKFDQEKKLQDLPKNEVEKTIEDFKNFTANVSSGTSSANGSSNGHYLPPIRGSNGTTQQVKTKNSAAENAAPKKNPLPKDPSYWNKIDKQLDNDNDENYDNICKERISTTHVNEDVQLKPAHELLDKQKNTAHHEDVTAAANNEKNKGNEAFRCGDFKEALIYYNRSIEILPTAASYNNKAITLIKLEKFSEALTAAETVISLEPGNIKAHMRRGIANQSLSNLDDALQDFTKVCELEPSNKRGKELLQTVTKEIDKQYANRKKKGHRMKIEEVTTPKIEEITTDNGLSDNQEHNFSKSKLKIDEVTIEDETVIENNDKKAEPLKDNSYMDGMYDPKVAEFLSGGQSLFEDTLNNNNTSKGLHSSKPKDFGDKLSNMLNYTKQFIQQNKDNVNQEELNKISAELNKLEELKDENQTQEEKSKKLDEIIGEDPAGKTAAASKTRGTASLLDTLSHNRLFKDLPGSVVTMKNKGNQCYKAGQYDVANDNYTHCINELLKDRSSFTQSLATFYSNRASCQTRMGNSKACISDCNESVKLNGGSAKVFLKRAEAYESLEKYFDAYVDYQNAHALDSSLSKALQACSRIGRMLQDEHGKSWREKLPKSELTPTFTPPPPVLTEQKDDVKRKEETKEDTKSEDLNISLDNTFKVSHFQNANKPSTKAAEPVDSKVTPSVKKVEPSVENEKPSVETSKPSVEKTVPPVETTVPPVAKGTALSPKIEEVTPSDEKPKPREKVESVKQQPNETKPTMKRGPSEATLSKEQRAKRDEKEAKVLNFYEMKEQGNEHVKKGNYEQAIKSYTQCADIMPKEIVSYTNRALCYLKLKDPEKAIADCNHALKLNKNHVKALFRRAQAQKMLQQYKESLADLAQVMKLEPGNNAAKKEMEDCKSEFTARLRSIQAENEAAKQQRDNKSKATSNGGGKKVVIEEITSDSPDLNGKTKLSTKIGKCPLAKELPTKSKETKKMTSYEFLHAWNNVKSKKTADYAELLSEIEASRLVDLLSNKLDGEILKNFIHTINEHFTGRETFRRGVQLLKSLCKASRFVTMLMFLNTTEKALLRSTVDSLEARAKQSAEKSLLLDVNTLRVSYQCS